jgi:hypothetical protein
MRFKSKNECVLYVLQQLDNIAQENDGIPYAEVNANFLTIIRAAIENHEIDINKVSGLLKEFIDKYSKGLELPQKGSLGGTIRKIDRGIEEQSDEDKWRNPLARRFESQMQIELLKNPTQKMMQAVRLISDRMVSILEGRDDLHEKFMIILKQEFHIIAFGSFKDKPEINEVIDVLKKNDPGDLSIIMHMHFKFARDIVTEDDGLEELIREYDCDIFNSEHYKDRGRKGSIEELWTKQMGLLVDEDINMNKGLPTSLPSWVSDSKAQAPDYSSAFTRSLIDNGVPYVAGPSGMTARFIAQMLAFSETSESGDALREKKIQQSYILAVTAYMVSAGFHSLHEVLWPIAICLPEQQLLPNYPTKQVQPGRYHNFYSLMGKIDREFSAIKDKAWGKFLDFFKTVYMPEVMQVKKNRGDASATRALIRYNKYDSSRIFLNHYTLNGEQLELLSDIVGKNGNLKQIDLRDSRIKDNDLRIIIPALKRSNSIESVELDADVDKNIQDEIEDVIQGDKGNLSK